ncbi:MAG TPA: phosphotransferase [Phenylobacterium sp.]|uniref:phosphotransferase n=1 Tax=Phenylobacterium sp. TaxID=1871053 RepID=UPI002B47CE52|nr:phosphotransferase [Phenylobacterium sp.]HKR90257.1 phosphotransferase [Phenylobacterium sp.]
MSQALAIPDAEQVSAAWLTEALRAGGLTDATVKSVSTGRVGTGQAARAYRFELEYERPDPSFPRSIVGKFPSTDPEHRKVAAEYKTYLREINFYRILQPQLSVSTPKCFYADIDGNGPDFILLLEDVSPARQGDQIAGCSPAVARRSVLDLVGLHAPSWRNPAMLDFDWLSNGDVDQYNAFIRKSYKTGYPQFLERCAGGLDQDELRVLRRLAETPVFPSEPPELKAYCLIHSDYRLDNLLVDDSVEPNRTFLVDWQTLIVGNPMRDLAYFLGGCLLPEDRRPVEQDIVRDYHGKLLAAGVEGYSWETCWDDYRRATFLGVMTAVVGMVFVDRTERGDQLFATMGKRHLLQALELGAEDFIR